MNINTILKDRKSPIYQWEAIGIISNLIQATNRKKKKHWNIIYKTQVKMK